MPENTEQPGHGTLDPYFDISELLNKLGVAYIVIVGRPGERGTRTWSNFEEFPSGGEVIKKETRHALERVLAATYGEEE